MNTTNNTNTLIEFFSIPAPKAATKKPRVNRTVARVEAAGYQIEKVGGQWEVWSDQPEHAGVTAIYDRLADIELPPWTSL
jgi:hypothetical protein